jgi:Flp pilus assembly pilin Flp
MRRLVEERTEMWRRVPTLTVACLRRLARGNNGQDLLEYALLASLIALAAMGAMTTVGDTISDVLWAAIAAVKF